MQRSIASVALGGGLQEKLYAIAAAGFDSIELTEAELAFSEMSPLQINALLSELGLGISLFHSLTDIDGVADDRFCKNLQRAERKFELMSQLGAKLLRIPASATIQTPEEKVRAARQLAALAGRAAVHGVRIGYEPTSSASGVRRSDDAWRIVTAAGHENLGLIVDCFEMLASGENLAVLASIPGERIFLAQLADAPSLSVDFETARRHFRCYPGQGALDVISFASHVLDTGYAGPFSLDVQSDAIRALPTRAAALDGYRSLVYVEECLARIGRSVPSGSFTADNFPGDPSDETVEFIEFSVSATSQSELDRWFTGLGFHCVGRHKSKDVTLYRQGDVLLILNAGSDTFAHYYHHLHGPSVCAIGLRLSDPAVLLARADFYKYKRYEERIGPQEYMMPAIRAPDGSLIHLLGPDYDPHTDFVIDDGSGKPDAGIVRVDHLVRAVPEEQFDSWVLFYKAVLGLKADDSLEVSDLHGMVKSRAMHDPQNRLRLPLAFSDSPKSTIAKSLSTFGGAGINQIAFECHDIFASIASMRTQGVPLLKIPANYYRELAEDRDVPRKLVERLQAYSILYDRDSTGGEFFHAYTDFFDGRFFFEVVQRTNGYDRYGESNAPVRMAAQAKHRLTRAAS